MPSRRTRGGLRDAEDGAVYPGRYRSLLPGDLAPLRVADGWRRLRLRRQRGDQLVPGVEQFRLVNDVVAVEDGAATCVVDCPSREHECHDLPCVGRQCVEHGRQSGALFVGQALSSG